MALDEYMVPVIVAAIAGIPPTILAIATLIQSKKNGKKSDEIHVLTNSNLTKVKEDLVEAKEEIRGLKQHILKGVAEREEMQL